MIGGEKQGQGEIRHPSLSSGHLFLKMSDNDDSMIEGISHISFDVKDEPEKKKVENKNFIIGASKIPEDIAPDLLQNDVKHDTNSSTLQNKTRADDSPDGHVKDMDEAFSELQKSHKGRCCQLLEIAGKWAAQEPK